MSVIEKIEFFCKNMAIEKFLELPVYVQKLFVHYSNAILDDKKKHRKKSIENAEKIRELITPRVVKIQRKNGKVIQDCDTYIGRNCYMGGWKLQQSKWHNPYTVKKYGNAKNAIKLFKEYILQKPKLLSDLSELYGKTLGCWCGNNCCHGNILVELIHSHVPVFLCEE